MNKIQISRIFLTLSLVVVGFIFVLLLPTSSKILAIPTIFAGLATLYILFLLIKTFRVKEVPATVAGVPSASHEQLSETRQNMPIIFAFIFGVIAAALPIIMNVSNGYLVSAIFAVFGLAFGLFVGVIISLVLKNK